MHIANNHLLALEYASLHYSSQIFAWKKISSKAVSQEHQMNYCIIHRKISLLCWESNKRLLLFDTLLPFGSQSGGISWSKGHALSQVGLQAWWTENMGLEDCRVKPLEQWWIDKYFSKAFSPPGRTIFQSSSNTSNSTPFLSVISVSSLISSMKTVPYYHPSVQFGSDILWSLRFLCLHYLTYFVNTFYLQALQAVKHTEHLCQYQQYVWQ